MDRTEQKLNEELQKACENKNANPERIKKLLDLGADPNTADDCNDSVLHWAAVLGNENVARILIEAGADIDAGNEYFDTPLHQAGSENVAMLLISNGAYIDAKNKYEQTPLHIAIQDDREGVARKLIQAGANLEVKDNRENTPLHYAVIRENEDVVRILISAGADIDAKNEDGDKPEDLASAKDKAVFLAAREARKLGGVAAEVPEESFFSSAPPVVGNPPPPCVRPFSERSTDRPNKKEGDDMDQQDKLDAELWKAVLNNNVEAAGALLRLGADPDAEPEKAYIGDIEAYIDRQKKANPDAWFPDGDLVIGSDRIYCGNGWLPLDLAAAHGQAEISELLHKAGGRGWPSQYAIDPLELAAANGHETVTAFLLSTGDYDPLAVSDFDNNAASAAAMSGSEKTLGLIVGKLAEEGRLNEMLFCDCDIDDGRMRLATAAMAAGYDPNVLKDGSTALHKAARSWGDDLDALKFLIRSGASLDARDDKMNTPLHVALAEGNTRVSEVLLEAGSDVMARNASGMTPADVAEAKSSEIAPLLRSYQENIEFDRTVEADKSADQTQAPKSRRI